MRGWPIKPAALMHCQFQNVLFIDADCFPLRNPEFLFETPEFKEYGALFWPDNKFHRMVPDAAIWGTHGLAVSGGHRARDRHRSHGQDEMLARALPCRLAERSLGIFGTITQLATRTSIISRGEN